MALGALLFLLARVRREIALCLICLLLLVVAGARGITLPPEMAVLVAVGQMRLEAREPLTKVSLGGTVVVVLAGVVVVLARLAQLCQAQQAGTVAQEFRLPLQAQQFLARVVAVRVGQPGEVRLLTVVALEVSRELLEP